MVVNVNLKQQFPSSIIIVSSVYLHIPERKAYSLLWSPPPPPPSPSPLPPSPHAGLEGGLGESQYSYDSLGGVERVDASVVYGQGRNRR